MIRWPALTAIAILMSRGGALAQAPAVPPVEVWASVGPGTWRESAFLESDYEPRLVGVESTGRAHQRLAIDPGAGPWIEFGTNVFPSRVIGVQGFVTFGSTPVSGTNTPYELQLQYVSVQPPNNQPVPVKIDTQIPWDDTTGHLDTWGVGGGVVGRAGNPRVRATWAGGLAWQRISGRIASLGYTEFRLGGHSTLFTDNYAARFSLTPKVVTGGYLAASLDVNLSARTALTFGTRLLLARQSVLSTTVDAVARRDAGFEAPPVSEVQAQLAPHPVLLNPKEWSVTVGIKALAF